VRWSVLLFPPDVLLDASPWFWLEGSADVRGPDCDRGRVDDMLIGDICACEGLSDIGGLRAEEEEVESMALIGRDE
jgi:hypothetical protein